jgi:hypothetical protein
LRHAAGWRWRLTSRGDYVCSFFQLAGDANHDPVVDITDLGILATNWQGSPKTFAEGDFNYDGKVDITDLGILATNWQKTLPSFVQPQLAATRWTVPSAFPGRHHSELLPKASTDRSLLEDVGLGIQEAS